MAAVLGSRVADVLRAGEVRFGRVARERLILEASGMSALLAVWFRLPHLGHAWLLLGHADVLRWTGGL
jgi:hypothetical protein